MKFSIIIPVYNVEAFLEECLESILEQNYTDYEVLLINDGSIDSSGMICDRYSEKDSRFTVFHQQNKGVSAARNLGIENAVGEWISFIDSDDLIEPNYLKAFSENISCDSDLVIQGIKRIGKVNDTLSSFANVEKISKQAFFDHYSIWPHYFSSWGKVFRKIIIMKQNLRFDESINYGEDSIFNLDYAMHTKKSFTLLPNTHYLYRINFSGLTSTRVGYYEREYLFRYVKDHLKKYTDKKDELYWYSTPAFKMLYMDKRVENTYKTLKFFVKNHKAEILNIFKGDKLSLKFITFLIRWKCYFLLNLIFKFIYRKEVKF